VISHVAQNPLRFLIRQGKDSRIITIFAEVRVVDEPDAIIVEKNVMMMDVASGYLQNGGFSIQESAHEDVGA
jgi:hypothetical protein